MNRVSPLLLALSPLAVLLVSAQTTDPTATFPATPLAEKRFSYPSEIPYKSDEDHLIRGIQVGYNLCNETTEGQDSLCQTSFLNSLDDFCLWGPPEPNSVVGDTEGETVAWCTKPGRGTRLIPAGALKGVQFMRTSAYVQVVGYIDQTQVNIQAGDFGGEMDPHGADLRGNPLGGLFYSNAFSGNNDTFDQVVEWHNFMGSDTFCLKACDQTNPDAARFCEHIYDRIGCAYNAPHNAQNGTFEACEGEVQDFPGIYTGADGQVSTYTQEGEGTEPVPPYTPRVPASSNCVQFTSSALFAALGEATGAPGSSGSAGGSNSGTATRTSGAPGATGTSGDSDDAGSDGALSMPIISIVGVLSIVFTMGLLS